MTGTPLVAWGSFDFVEASLGRLTHLLHVDFKDAGRWQKTPREDHAEFLLERFSARRTSGGGASGMVYGVSACVSRQARHTPPSAYQHGPSY